MADEQNLGEAAGVLKIDVDIATAVKKTAEFADATEKNMERADAATVKSSGKRKKAIEETAAAAVKAAQAEAAANKKIDDAIQSIGNRTGSKKPRRKMEDIRAEAEVRQQRISAATEQRRIEREQGWAEKRAERASQLRQNAEDRERRREMRSQIDAYEERRKLRDKSLADQNRFNKLTEKQQKREFNTIHGEALDMNRAVDATAKAKQDAYNRDYREALRENERIDKGIAKDRRDRERDTRAEQKKTAEEQKRNFNLIKRDAIELGKVQTKILGAPLAVQRQINAVLNAPGAQNARFGMRAVGATSQQSLFAQLSAGGIAPNVAQFAAGAGGRRPPGWTAQPQGGGFGGWWNRNSGSVGRTALGVAAGFGINAGANMIGEGVRGVVEASRVATAYERQQVAAKNLAGSQQNLNELMEAYTSASGGAVGKVTALANVTRLLATGFADTAPNVEKFVRATRGAGIALGKPQDYIIQETQLAVSNTSYKRLDQIGLGIEEVQDKVESLRAANKQLTEEAAFQEAVLGLLDTKYGGLTQTMEGQVTGLEKLAAQWEDSKLSIGQSQKSMINDTAEWAAEMLGHVDRLLTEGEARRKRNTLFQINALADGMVSSGMWQPGSSSVRNFKAQGLQYMDQPTLLPSAANQMTRPNAPGSGGRTEDQIKTIQEGYLRREELDRKHNDAMLDAERDYAQSREGVIKNFAKSALREEQDFARGRARSLRDYERSIMDMMRDSRDREAEWQEDLDETIADAREDSNENIAEKEKRYQEEREKNEAAHRDRMLKAAGQLDAIGVLEERKAWKRENEERKKSHEESISDEKEALQERIDDALEAHQERLEDAREADAKRLEDMRLDRARQLADEDEDRAIQLARAQEDHNDQLEELDRQHSLRMNQIAEQAAEENQAFEDALMADLDEVGIYIDGYQKKMRERDELQEKWFDNFIKLMEKRLKDEAEKEKEAAIRRSMRGVTPPTLDSGISASLVPSGISAVASSSYSQVSTSNSRMVTIAPGAIAVYTTPGMEAMVGDLVEERMIELLGAV